MSEFDTYRIYRDVLGRRWKPVGLGPDGSMLLRKTWSFRYALGMADRGGARVTVYTAEGWWELHADEREGRGA